MNTRSSGVRVLFDSEEPVELGEVCDTYLIPLICHRRLIVAQIPNSYVILKIVMIMIVMNPSSNRPNRARLDQSSGRDQRRYQKSLGFQTFNLQLGQNTYILLIVIILLHSFNFCLPKT